MAGLLTLLSALVLRLLIWTAYGIYSSRNVATQTLAAKILQLDLALADYGPEAGARHTQLRQDLARTAAGIGRRPRRRRIRGGELHRGDG